MKVLNLVNIEKSDIKWELSQFPDGQQQIKVEHVYNCTGNALLSALSRIHITIKSRLNNWLDLEKIVCANQSLKKLGYENIHLYVPYVLGARSDRSFNEGENNYLKHVLCPIINLQGFKSVTVLDPHSDCLEMGLNGFKRVSNKDLVHFAVSDILGKTITKDTNLADWSVRQTKDPSYVLISPDAGASKKIYKIAEHIGYKGDVITCSKDRDTDGKLTKCVVPMDHTTYENKDFIIIDDICDGGGTFIPIAEKIRKLYPDKKTSKIYLIVTHGIFSKGFEELNRHFDGIYCTNSYRDTPTHEYPVWEKPIEVNKLVKQLDVFQ